MCYRPARGHGDSEADSEALSGAVVLATYTVMEWSIYTMHLPPLAHDGTSKYKIYFVEESLLNTLPCRAYS